jgi:Fe-Mn family superoxide dismutase
MKQVILTLALILTALFSGFAQHKLPGLPYKYSALEPFVDSTTMYIHLNNHHATYVNNLNKALEKYPELQNKSIDELLKSLNKLPVDIQTVVRNSGGGHFNHCLFWTVLAPAETAPMSAKLEKLIMKNFESVDAFKAEFEKAATSRFGSGWAWVIKLPSGKLRIISTANQDNSLMPTSEVKGKPILTLDVWEHAYYLKYQSKRAAYIKAFWNIVNWTEVERLYFE